MFRDLIPLLADEFHLVAPDLPGFGKSAMPDPASSTTPSIIWRTSSTASPRCSASTASRSTCSTTARRSASGSPPGTRSGSPRSSPRTATPTRRPQRRLGPGPGLLEGPVARQPGGGPVDGAAGDDDLAVHPRRPRRDDGQPGRLRARQLLPGPPRRRRDPARPAAELRQQHRRSTRPGRSTSAPASRRCSRSGAATTRSSSRPAPRRSSATSPTPTSASCPPATSPSRPTSTRSRARSWTSSVLSRSARGDGRRHAERATAAASAGRAA